MSRKARTIGEFMGWIKRLVAGDADAKRLVLSERDSLRKPFGGAPLISKNPPELAEGSAGFKPGEQRFMKYNPAPLPAPLAAIAFLTFGPLGRRVAGQNHAARRARRHAKISGITEETSAIDRPPGTQGAVLPSWPSPAAKAAVLQSPFGTLA